MIELTAGGYAARLRLGNGAEPRPEGLFAGDTRLISRLAWRTDAELEVAGLRQDDGEAAWAELPVTGRNQPAPFVLQHHLQLSDEGLHNSVRVTSLISEPQSLTLRLELASDMADQFALRLDNSKFPRFDQELTAVSNDNGLAVMATATREGYAPWHRECLIQAPGARISHEMHDGEIVALAEWQLTLAPLAESNVTIAVRDPKLQPVATPPRDDHLEQVLGSLLISAPGTGLPVVAAGVPWFITLFGRDSLWTSLLAQAQFPWLLDNVVRALAHFQGTTTDHARQEQPGKIVHEVRSGAFAALDLVPYARYYGGVDTTPLWLMMLSRCSKDTRRALRPQAEAAVEWILGPGGLTETGFVRYSADESGLIHQGWKDSHDAVLTDGGQPATQGVALVEVQGYAYAALLGAARMARDEWSEPAIAERYLSEAETLRERFLAEFVEGRSFPAMAILADGEAVTAASSNLGHLLLTGILDDDTAHTVARRLLEPDMYTGYGIRTLSTEAPAYSPASYHRGSVWPHDTAVAMLGMQKFGFAEAQVVAHGLLRLTDDLGGRLPEYVLGLPADGHLPLAPAQSAYPQAWAAAAALAARHTADKDAAHDK